MAGAYLGQAAVFNEDFECSSNQAIAKISLKKNSVNSYFLSTFLNCEFGQFQIKRYQTGTGQPNLNLGLIKTIDVPKLSLNFQNVISDITTTAIKHHKKSINLYQLANEILLSKLKLKNWQPERQLNYVKNYSDTKQAGRIDAEYFQPFYSEIEEKLKSKGLVYIKDICNVINYGTVPTSPYSEDGSGIPYIKGLNLKNLEISTDKLDYITNTQDLPKKVFTKEGDIIISQMGTVGNCGIVSKKQENWIFASFTIRIRLRDKSKYHPNYVALYVETIAKPYYLFRNIAQASVRQNTDLPTIKNMPIPDLNWKYQLLIADKVKQSFALKKQSKQLLEIAKQGVEIAIEKDENTAQNWIDDQLKINNLTLITKISTCL